MKKYQLCLLSLFTALSITACDGSSSATEVNNLAEPSADSSLDLNEYNGSLGTDTTDSYQDDYEYEEGQSLKESSAQDVDYSGTEEVKDIDEETSASDSDNVDKLTEKLVYNGTLAIDTLNFNQSVSDFSDMISKYGGFIETENYSDSSYYDDYSFEYVDPETKRQRYTATVRIPSKNYSKIFDEAGNLGDVRTRDSTVTNFTQEYSDLTIKLDILEKNYKQYSELLEKAEDTATIVELTNQLRNIETEIEYAKSRMRNIDNDVAYSYLNVTIKEVSKYDDKPMNNDTFIHRLANTCKESITNFQENIEGLLFWIILALPEILLVIIIIIIIIAVVKSYQKKHAHKKGELNDAFMAMQNGVNTYQNQSSNTQQNPMKNGMNIHQNQPNNANQNPMGMQSKSEGITDDSKENES